MAKAETKITMNVRKHLFPRRFYDWLCFLLIGIFLPVIFMFELIFVLPAFHVPGSLWHTFTFLFAIFLLFQIEGNFLGCLMVDTSVNFKTIRAPSESRQTLDSLGWHDCKTCKKLAPPRSWHCSICKTCILKRDHHCLFVGCCVGHKNHRYFIMFIVYLFIGATYAFVYNTLFVWIIKGNVFYNWLSILRMLCPLLMMVSGSMMQNMTLIYYNLNILAVVYSAILLAYQAPILFMGGVCYEKSKNYPYNMGSWRQNLRTVFGERMHLVWLSPLLKSELLDDGISWQSPENPSKAKCKTECDKIK